MAIKSANDQAQNTDHHTLVETVLQWLFNLELQPENPMILPTSYLQIFDLEDITSALASNELYGEYRKQLLLLKYHQNQPKKDFLKISTQLYNLAMIDQTQFCKEI